MINRATTTHVERADANRNGMNKRIGTSERPMTVESDNRVFAGRARNSNKFNVQPIP